MCRLAICSLLALLLSSTLLHAQISSIDPPSPNLQAQAHRDAAVALETKNDYDGAIQEFQQALSIEREIKDRKGEGQTLVNLGIDCLSLKQYEKAIDFFQQDLPIAQEVKDRMREAKTLYDIGVAYFYLSQYKKALETFQQAIPIEQEVKDRAGEGNSLYFLGETYGHLSQYEKAIDCLQRAIPIEHEVKHRAKEAQAQSSLSNFTTLLNQTKSNGSPTPQASSNVVFHEELLNQAFRFTAEELNQALDKGKQLAQQGKKWDDVYKSVAQMPRGVKGEKGKSHESTVYCTTLNAVDLTASAYKAANNYDPLPPRHSKNGYAKRVHFFVSLESDPKVGKNALDRDRLADEEDVQVTKFVLTDDKGNVINPVDTSFGSGVQEGVINFSGTYRQEHTETSQTNENADASAYDSRGDSAYAEGSRTRTTTRTRTKYVPWSESHPYFTAKYHVHFPLFDANGQPLIKTDAKSITLHIITPNGEKQATYDLQPPKI